MLFRPQLICVRFKLVISAIKFQVIEIYAVALRSRFEGSKLRKCTLTSTLSVLYVSYNRGCFVPERIFWNAYTKNKTVLSSVFDKLLYCTEKVIKYDGLCFHFMLMVAWAVLSVRAAIFLFCTLFK